MKLQPIEDRVIVERIKADDVTTGGIVLPDSAKEKPARGKVISAGPGKRMKDGKLRPLHVKKNDIVVFSSYAGDEFKSGAKELLIMREEDILAIVE